MFKKYAGLSLFFFVLFQPLAFTQDDNCADVVSAAKKLDVDDFLLSFSKEISEKVYENFSLPGQPFFYEVVADQEEPDFEKKKLQVKEFMIKHTASHVSDVMVRALWLLEEKTVQAKGLFSITKEKATALIKEEPDFKRLGFSQEQLDVIAKTAIDAFFADARFSNAVGVDIDGQSYLFEIRGDQLSIRANSQL